MKTKAIIVAIDGTLANIDHRRHFVDPFYDKSLNIPCHGEGGLCDGEIICTACMQKCLDFKKDWKSFKEAMKDDTPNEWVCDLLNALWVGYWNSTNNYCSEFIFVTGREEKYRELTSNQIYQWTSIYTPTIFMRPTDDFRADVDIKKEIYENHIKDKYDVVFCVDDNTEIVKLWRSLGLVCLDCAGYER